MTFCCIIGSGFGRPGAGFCRLDDDHDGPHEFVWWDGEVTQWEPGAEEVILEHGWCRTALSKLEPT